MKDSYENPVEELMHLILEENNNQMDAQLLLNKVEKRLPEFMKSKGLKFIG